MSPTPFQVAGAAIETDAEQGGGSSDTVHEEALVEESRPRSSDTVEEQVVNDMSFD